MRPIFSNFSWTRFTTNASRRSPSSVLWTVFVCVCVCVCVIQRRPRCYVDHTRGVVVIVAISILAANKLSTTHCDGQFLYGDRRITPLRNVRTLVYIYIYIYMNNTVIILYFLRECLLFKVNKVIDPVGTGHHCPPSSMTQIKESIFDVRSGAQQQDTHW